MCGAAGVAEGADLVVEGVPVAAEHMTARDHDVDFFGARCHTRPDLGDPCGKWRQASGEAGADGGHRDSRVAERLDGRRDELVVDADRAGRDVQPFNSELCL